MTVNNNTEYQKRMDQLVEEIIVVKTELRELREGKQRRMKWLKRSAWIGVVGFGSFALAGTIVWSQGANLQQYMMYDGQISPPPLDSMATWLRPDNGAAGGPSELLSLIADGSQTNSFQWPLYVEMRGTTSPNATAATSQSTGVQVREFIRSAGSPWSAGMHSEIHHGQQQVGGNATPTNGTSILYNGEMYSYSNGGRTIGMNLQCSTDYLAGTQTLNPALSKCDDALNIQSTSGSTYWQNGIHFDTPSSHIAGNIGINFDQAYFNLGMDLGNNSMRMNAGQRIALEKYGSVYLMFNPKTGNVELYKNNVLVAHW